METLRLESHRAPPAMHPQLHPQPDSPPRPLPHPAAELILPLLRATDLANYLLVPLAARMHTVSRHLSAVALPAAAALLAAAYRSLVVSAAVARLAVGLSRGVLGVAMGVLWYVSGLAVAKNFRGRMEKEMYNFLLGPGNVLMKMVFWLGWWSVLGAFISWPWWFLTT